MTRHDAIDTAREQPETIADRFASVELADGAVVVYDTENHASWVHSDAAADLEEVR